MWLVVEVNFSLVLITSNKLWFTWLSPLNLTYTYNNKYAIINY
jgi:hypothetical protein